MRLLADRQRVERVMRGVAALALAAWIANALRPQLSRDDVVRDRDLSTALPRWTRTAVDSIHVILDTVPDDVARSWLVALRRAGTGVSWSAPTIPASAVEVFRSGDPSGEIVALSAAPGGSVRILSDALGPIDTLPTVRYAVASRVRMVDGDLAMTTGRQSARVVVAPVARPGQVLVVGQAGWEGKFVIAALEERGWIVSSRLSLSPEHTVSQGARAELDARFDAVILLDSATAESVRSVESFVRAGGGLVIAGDANRASWIATVAAWRAARREVAPLGTVPADTFWRGGSRVPLDTSGLRGAIAIELRAGRGALVARRHYAGRVIGVGYDQTWRWRMTGGERSVAEHRDWWSRVVASVARRPALTTAGAMGAGPLASLHAVLGPPSLTRRAPPTAPGAASHALGLLVLGALLSEWLLRRSRGDR